MDNTNTQKKTTNDADSKIKEYMESFNLLEKIAYEIAKSRLKTSFDIEKSIGFKNSK